MDTIEETEVLSEIKSKLLTQAEEQSQVIVHCSYTGSMGLDRIRIWRSTYLVPHGSADRSRLLHAENISMYPVWTPIPNGRTHNFTLIFSALPKDCAVFDLFEDIPQDGGFRESNIPRNKTDVYRVQIN